MKILIAEDDAVSRKLLTMTLQKWGFDVVAVEDGASAWEILQKDDAPSLAILDWMMPGMDGVQVCDAVRKRLDRPYVYTILLTAKDRKEDIIQGLEAGADDYLIKPMDIYELKARLKVGCRILDLQNQLLEACAQLRDQATSDVLTGLYNRRAILEILEREFAKVTRSRSSLGIIMLDIDHFKRINDTHGHLAGDAVLRALGQELKRVVRQHDALGRYGGEEFLVVLPGCLPTELSTVAERLRSHVAGQVIPYEDQSFTLTISAGAALALGGAVPNLNAFIKEADDALYKAKKAGRNRVEFSANALLPRASHLLLESKDKAPSLAWG